MSLKSRIDRLGRHFGRPKPAPICPTCGGSRCGAGRVMFICEEPMNSGISQMIEELLASGEYPDVKQPVVYEEDLGSKLCPDCKLPVTDAGRAAITNPGQPLEVFRICFDKGERV